MARGLSGSTTSVRHRLHPHRRRRPGRRRAPARPRPECPRVLRPDRPGRTACRRAGAAPQRGQGARRDERARDGLRQAGSRIRDPLRRTGVSDRVLPAGRARRPRRRLCRGRPAARSGGSRDLGLLRLVVVPARTAGACCTRRARGRRPVDRSARAARRTVPFEAGGDAEGPRRGRRGAARAGRMAGHRRGLGVRPRALRRAGRRPSCRAGRDAPVPGHRRVPDAVPARATRRSGSSGLRPLRQLRRPVPRQRGERRVHGRRSGGPVASRRRARAAPAVADRDAGPRDRRARQDRRRPNRPNPAGRSLGTAGSDSARGSAR